MPADSAAAFATRDARQAINRSTTGKGRKVGGTTTNQGSCGIGHRGCVLTKGYVVGSDCGSVKLIPCLRRCYSSTIGGGTGRKIFFGILL